MNKRQFKQKTNKKLKIKWIYNQLLRNKRHSIQKKNKEV